MTETEFLEKILELSSGGAKVLVYTADFLPFVRKLLACCAGIPFELAEPEAHRTVKETRKWHEAAMILKGREIIISENFDKMAAEIPRIQPDYVLDERDFTIRTCAGKQ